jgi:hypothetical protein
LANAEQEIRDFLRRRSIGGSNTLEMALVLARSMVAELRSVTGEWESEVALLERRLEVRQAELTARRGSLFGPV